MHWLPGNKSFNSRWKSKCWNWWDLLFQRWASYLHLNSCYTRCTLIPKIKARLEFAAIFTGHSWQLLNSHDAVKTAPKTSYTIVIVSWWINSILLYVLGFIDLMLTHIQENSAFFLRSFSMLPNIFSCRNQLLPQFWDTL